MAMADEIKIITFNGKKVERRITLNLVRKVAGGGMEAAGDVFTSDGVKTGFYRYKSRYGFPIFFSKTGKRLVGGAPVNKAIKEVVHDWAVSINAKRKEARAIQYDGSREKEAAIRKTIREEVKYETPAPMPGKVNVNVADRDVLASLPGVSLPLAARIIEYRESEGGFQSTEDLMKIKGIGQAKYDKLKDKVRI